jgi:hypothetical protein
MLDKSVGYQAESGEPLIVRFRAVIYADWHSQPPNKKKSIHRPVL